MHRASRFAGRPLKFSILIALGWLRYSVFILDKDSRPTWVVSVDCWQQALLLHSLYENTGVLFITYEQLLLTYTPRELLLARRFHHPCPSVPCVSCKRRLSGMLDACCSPPPLMATAAACLPCSICSGRTTSRHRAVKAPSCRHTFFVGRQCALSSLYCLRQVAPY